MNFEDFVECKIISISVVETETGENVLIYIEDHGKKNWLLSALSVSELLVNEMRTQNIIDRFNFLRNGQVVPQPVRDKIYYLLHGKFPDGENKQGWVDVERVVNDIECSVRVFLEIEAVYGASVILIAKDISLSQVDTVPQ